MRDESAAKESNPAVSRRGFVGAALAVGALAATGLALPNIAVAEHDDKPRRAPGPSAARSLAAFALDEATIADLQRMIASGQYTSRSLCEAYLARIAEIDKAGPTLRTVTELNPDARTIADSLGPCDARTRIKNM
jgi:amidase